MTKEDYIADLEARIEAFRQAKLELDELEGAIDRQTYDEHRKNDFDTPDDAKLYIVLTAKDERRLSKALSAMTKALTGLPTPSAFTSAEREGT